MLARLRVAAGDLRGVEVPVAPGEVLSLDALLAVVHLERDRGLADGDDGCGVVEVVRVVLSHVADLELPHGDELVVSEELHDDVLPRNEGGLVPTGTGYVLDDVHGSTLPCSGVTLHRSVVAERSFQPVRATLQTTSACSDLLLRQHDEGVEFHGGFPRADVEDPARRQLDPTIRGVRTGVEEGRLLRLGEFRRDLLELVGGHGRCHSFFFKDFVDQAS